MIIGETRQASLYFDTELQGEEAEYTIREVFWHEEIELGIQYSPVEFHVAETPQGKALVGEARVIDVGWQAIDTNWLKSLQPHELKYLRALTRRSWENMNPGIPILEHNIDQIIAAAGERAARKVLSVH